MRLLRSWNRRQPGIQALPSKLIRSAAFVGCLGHSWMLWPVFLELLPSEFMTTKCWMLPRVTWKLPGKGPLGKPGANCSLWVSIHTVRIYVAMPGPSLDARACLSQHACLQDGMKMMKLPTDSTKVRDCTSLHHLMLPSLSVRYPSQPAILACSRANSSVVLQCRELCEGPWMSEPIVSKILPSRQTSSFWELPLPCYGLMARAMCQYMLYKDEPPKYLCDLKWNFLTLKPFRPAVRRDPVRPSV